jgi:hypothetical protein
MRGHIIEPKIAKALRLHAELAGAFHDIGRLTHARRERILKTSYDTLALLEGKKAA